MYKEIIHWRMDHSIIQFYQINSRLFTVSPTQVEERVEQKIITTAALTDVDQNRPQNEYNFILSLRFQSLCDFYNIFIFLVSLVFWHFLTKTLTNKMIHLVIINCKSSVIKSEICKHPPTIITYIINYSINYNYLYTA